MKKNREKLFHSTKTSEEFLFYKTDDKIENRSIEPALESVGRDFEEFPEILTGKAFFDHAMSVLEGRKTFSTMAVKIDENNALSLKNVLTVQKAINKICEQKLGIYGQLDTYLFGCFFPDLNSCQCLETGKILQKNLSDKKYPSVTIGVASYPGIDYQKDQIFDNALKALDHAVFFGPNSSVVFDDVSLNISGDHFYQKGDIRQAIKEFDAALKINKKNVNVLNSLGVCYAVLGEFDQALEYFETARAIDSNEVMSWYNTGLVYKLKKDNEKALVHFLKANEIGSDLFEVVFQTGKMYFEMKDPEKGKRYYQRAIDLKPANGPNHRFLGECYTEIGMIDQAISTYRKAVKENPNDAHSLSALGYLFDITEENPDIAVVFSKQSVDISPENGLFRQRLGNLYLKQNKLKEALSEFKTAHDLGFDSTVEIEKTDLLIHQNEKQHGTG